MLWFSKCLHFSLQEVELQGAMSDLQSQLEAEKQHSELAKVSETGRKVRLSLMANTAPLCSTQVEVSELTAKLLAMQQQVSMVTYEPKNTSQLREGEGGREGGREGRRGGEREIEGAPEVHY